MSNLTQSEQAKRAHAYLRASMESGFTGLPDEYQHSRQQLMRDHERRYSRVREHALAGANQDFDVPLTAGEREHQRHLREQEGLTERDVREIRKDLRGPGAQAAAGSPRRSPSSSSLPRLPRARRGSAAVRIIGGALILILLYLLFAGKGISDALARLSKSAVGAVGVWMAPEDPIAAAERALGARPSTSSSRTSGSAGAAGVVSAGGLGNHAPSSAAERRAQANYAAGRAAPPPSRVVVHRASPSESSAFIKALKRAQAAH